MERPSKNQIRELRLEYGMTQAACAKTLDVTARQWRRYESGENAMSGPLWVYFKNKKLWLKT